LHRLLLISSNSSGRGGGERYLVFLTKGLHEMGCEVHALLSDVDYMNGWAKSLIEEGAVVHRHPFKSLSQRPLRFLQSTLDSTQIEVVSAFCRRIAPDAILVNQQYDEDGLDYLMGALKAEVAPVAGVMHMPMTGTKDNRPFGRLRGSILGRWYKKYAYRLILVSEGAKAEFESYYDYPRPTYVINNSIPLDLKRNDSPRILFPPGIPVVGFVGQFVEQKNLSCLLQAWLEALQSVDSRLLLVGDGPQRTELENCLHRSAPPGSWHVTGWVATPEDFLNELDLFVLSSHFEGLPFTLLEAAGRGIPAVVAPFNGAIDVSRRASWVRVASGHSVAEMTQLMTTTMNDLGALKKMAQAGLQDFQCYFSLRRMAGEVLRVLGLEGRA
jgi:glycosyltransferase involved in cell wall biosynthesis